MMLQIGVGYMARPLRPLQTQPAQGLTVVVSSNDEQLEVSATSITITVPAPSAHAGTYPLVLADLARGPVCLAAPSIRDANGTLTAEPGLWACDASRGATTIARQWLVDKAAVENATGLSFVPVPAAAAQEIVLAETVRQNGAETSGLSEVFTLPAKAAPEATGLSVTADATLSLVADPDGTVQVEIVEPKIYAGSHTIAAARMATGPVWLVPARIQGTAQPGSQLSILYRGLCVSDAEGGPVILQGQWQRGGSPIPGATGETYQVVAADAGRKIAFLETATNSRGARPQLSNEIAIGGTS